MRTKEGNRIRKEGNREGSRRRNTVGEDRGNEGRKTDKSDEKRKHLKRRRRANNTVKMK